MVPIPLVQIVHISDLHAGLKVPLIARGAHKFLEFTEYDAEWTEKARSGFGYWDYGSLLEFEDVLNQLNIEWPDGKKWLVVTGDLTTFGDDKSLAAVNDVLDELISYFDDGLVFFGNHDLWSADFLPRVRHVATKEKLLSALRSKDLMLEFAYGSVELLRLDTTADEWALNFQAIGQVSENELIRIKVNSSRTSIGSPLRIVAAHHPLAFVRCTDQCPEILDCDVVKNSVTVAEALCDSHIMLAGHTHWNFPPLGQAASGSAKGWYAPLSEGQIQLVTGTLCHCPLDEGAVLRPWSNDITHSFQVLRVYWVGGDRPYQVVRSMFTRTTEDGFVITSEADSLFFA